MPLKRGAGKRRHNHLTQQQKLHQHKYIQLVLNLGFAVLTDRRLKKCHLSELLVKGGQDHLTQKLSNNTASSKSRQNSYANQFVIEYFSGIIIVKTHYMLIRENT